MKANYDTAHSKAEERIYNEMTEIIFSAIVYFLTDKMGYNIRRTYAMLMYIKDIADGFRTEELNLKEVQEDLREKYGIELNGSQRKFTVILREDADNGEK